MFSSSFFRPFYYLIFSLVFLIIFISCFFFSNNLTFYNNLEISKLGFVWPTPDYTYINSYFGKRFSPTAGASSFHKGIDIGAPEGSPFVAVVDGSITFTGFLGGGGYTITLSSNNIKITYCHVSPNYIVEVGEFVYQGQVIGYVGPKNVYNVPRKYI